MPLQRSIDEKMEFYYRYNKMSDRDILKKVEEKAKDIVSALGGIRNQRESIFRVTITFYQAKDRWKKENPQIPREDIGRDLDNLIKPVFDGLGPIVGYRKKWGKDEETSEWKQVGKSTSADSRIVELSAKKVNSGTESEYLSIEVEKI